MERSQKKHRVESSSRTGAPAQKTTRQVQPAETLREQPRAQKKRPRVDAPAPAEATANGSSVTSSSKTGTAGQQHLLRALVLVGTYHSVMAGLVLRQDKFLLKFSIKHHVGCVNAVAASEKYLASSGTDERIHLFTVKDKGAQVADLGSLAPASEVTCLSFPTAHFLVCGCADGSLSVYRSRDWESALAVRVHDKPVSGIALHPKEGILAATVSADRFVALVDMQSGKLVTKSKLPLEFQTPHSVLFSPSGEYIAVATAYYIVLFDTMTLQPIARCVMAEKQPPYELHGMAFATATDIVVGAENGGIYVAHFSSVPALSQRQTAGGDPAPVVPISFTEAAFSFADAKEPDDIRHPQKHTSRIRSITSCGDTLITADTNGIIIAWIAEKEGRGNGLVGLHYRCSANCRGRVTSITVLPQEFQSS